MTVTVSASFGQFRQLVIEPAPAPTPVPNRADEYWWVECYQGMDLPLEPARISFRGDTLHGITLIGSDYEEEIAEREVRLVAPLPKHDQVSITRKDFMRMWDALRWIGRESPSFGWLDGLKADVDAQVAESD